MGKLTDNSASSNPLFHILFIESAPTSANGHYYCSYRLKPSLSFRPFDGPPREPFYPPSFYPVLICHLRLEHPDTFRKKHNAALERLAKVT